MLAASSNAASEFRNTGVNKERKRRPEHPFDEDHPAQRIDVDLDSAAEHLMDQRVDRPGFPEQQEPGDDVEHVGNAERDDRGDIEQLSQRRVGALGEPSLCRTDDEGEQRRSQCIEERVDERRAKRALGEDRREVPEREGPESAAGIELVQARISQKQERRQDCDAGERNQDDDLERITANQPGRSREGGIRHGRHHFANSS
jgi:hypothetical protein